MSPLRLRPIAFLIVSLLVVSCSNQTTNNRAFVFDKITDTIYQASGTGREVVGANSAIIINEDDALLVDSHMTPLAARRLLQELTTLTTKRVRYVVNTHFHFDHTDGNQVFGPYTDIIASAFTRQTLQEKGMETESFKRFTGGLPATIDTLKKQIAVEQDQARKQMLADSLGKTERFYRSLQDIKVTLPNLVLEKSLILYKGDREIQILHLGRAHTAGDVVVFLPKEKVLCTGDMLTEGLPYVGDGYLYQWVRTLEGLKKLDAETIIPGHGHVLQGKEKIDQLQSYLRDLLRQVEAFVERGATLDETVAGVNLSSHQPDYPSLAQGTPRLHVERAYEEAKLRVQLRAAAKAKGAKAQAGAEEEEGAAPEGTEKQK
ncbi:MAG: MBL fold metallo-hydrolase [Candidatus Latescibacteria bacterium]|nr:MBL fold metallo-hydrolase [Candidatus Latescibacterota bacterium]